MEQETEYLLRRELHERRMERSACSRPARDAHRALAHAYAARRLAMGSCALVEPDRWSLPAAFKLWLGAGLATSLMITATYLHSG